MSSKESATALTNEINRLDENIATNTSKMRELGRRIRLDEKERARLKDALIKSYEGEKK